MTGNHTPDVQAEILAAGAVACLPKPVVLDELLCRLDRCLPVLA
jgi:CheY-like chemotaxis protein